MASIQVKSGRRYVRGMAIALGIIAMLALCSILLIAAPGMQLFGAQGNAAAGPVPGMGNTLSLDTFKCALDVNCSLIR